MEDDLGWKTTLNGRQLWTKYNLELKTTLLEDGIGWKTTLDGRQPQMVDDLGWKTTMDFSFQL